MIVRAPGLMPLTTRLRVAIKVYVLLDEAIQ